MKKAVLVGINAYPGSPLQGCLNDVQDDFQVLTTIGKYPADNIRVVTDARANTAGIKDRMAWLRQGLKGPGDEVVFAYSGHGTQVRDRGPLDELVDHMDEAICPVNLNDPDYWSKGLIFDDDLGAWLKTFPTGTRIIVILDSCHSGTATRSLAPPGTPTARYLSVPFDIAMRSEGRKLPTVKFGRGLSQRHATHKEITPALNHILISGCRSNQTSADAFIAGKYHGALTYYLMDSIRKSPKGTIQMIYNATAAALKAAKYEQIPQLEGPAGLVNGPLFA